MKGLGSNHAKFEIMTDIFSRKLRDKDLAYIRDIFVSRLKLGASTKTFSKCIYELYKEDNLFTVEEFEIIEKVFNFKLESSDVELFMPVPAMISKSLLSYEHMAESFDKGNIKDIIAEDKYDGERVQVS